MVRGRSDCERCLIAFDSVARVGDLTGPGAVANDRSWLVRDPRGRYYLVYAYATEVAVFAPNGKFLATIGGKGAGPGEMEGATGVGISQGDSIHVLDWSLSRRSVFDPELRYVRSSMLTVQPQIRWVLMPDGRVVVNRDLRTPERIGQPLHVVGLDGNIDRSFGSETGLLRPDVPGLTTRSLAVASGSAVWAAHAHTYRLELFDISSGRELMRLTREADWFPDNERPTTQRPSSSTPPYARVAALHHSSDGLLWVLSAVPDSRWRTAVRSGEGGHAIITDPVRYYDWIIEVFDIKRGRLVISTRFDSHPPWFIGDGYAAQYREVDDDAYFSVFRVRLIGR